MKHLLPYSLFESKRQKYLYHLLDIDKIRYVLDTNKITAYTAGGGKISTTRNYMMSGYLGDNATTLFKLVIDWAKLEEDYETKEFVYRSATGIDFTEEEEQQIQTREIVDIWKYVDMVLLMKNRVENIKYEIWDSTQPSAWFTTIGGRHGNLPTIIKEIKGKIEAKGIPFYTQNKDKIETDGKYIDYIINHPIKEVEEKWVIAYRGDVRINPNATKNSFEYYATKEVLTNQKGEIFLDDLVVGSYLDKDVIEKYNLIVFDSYVDLKENIDKFKEDKIFSHLKTRKDDTFKPYMIHLEWKDYKDKWYMSNIRPISWIK